MVVRVDRWRASALLSFGAALACAPAERPRVAAGTERPKLLASLPGPAPRGRDAEHALALNQTCEECHVEIAREWRDSLHAVAHTDALYQRAFAIEPLAFCQGCHAPEANPHEPVPEAAAALGVACVTCHVLGGTIAASSRAAARGDTSAPHPLVRDGRLDATAACGGCHEFAFPDRGARARAELMQATLSEHALSPERELACADCHMPVVEAGGRRFRSHRFPGGRSEELVKGAMAVSAERTGDTTLRVSLTPRRVGHAFPTGDLFRRVEVSAEAVGSEWQVVGSDRRYLARHWERERKSPFGVVLRSVVKDDRPLGAPVTVELELGERAAGLPISWRVAYQRVEHPRSEHESDSLVEGEIVLSEGTTREEP